MKAIIKPFFISLFFLLLGGCSASNTIKRIKNFIEGEDRIEMPGSTAEVSPLMTKENEIILPPKAATLPETQDTNSDAVNKNDSEKSQRVAQEKIIEKAPSQKLMTPPVKKQTTPKPTKPKVKQTRKENIPTGSIFGQVKLTRKSKKIKDSNSILILTPKDPSVQLGNQDSDILQIDMKDKIYAPGYLTVKTGDKIEFTNSDEIRHNVFSPSGKNAFDLGTYGAGKKRAVTLQEEGIVKVYCNIHPKMATFVSVTENGISVVADKEGHFEFKNIPYGDYTIKAWNIRGVTESEIKISTSSRKEINFNILVENTKIPKHQNKFGEKYKKKSALFDDEFY